jgi:sugar lactone lactonase YvrE
VRRYLPVCSGIALAFATVSLFALAQDPSATIPATGQRASSYVQPQTSVASIRSAKSYVIVANGISPRALAVDPAGSIYLTNAVAPNRIFTLTGLANLAAAGGSPVASASLALVAGSGAAGSLGDGGNALAAQFDLKNDSLLMRSGVAVATDGTIFIADTLNSTIRRIAGSDSAEPGITRSIAGRWASPQSAHVAGPLGLALDRSGNLYVADHTSGEIDLLPDATGSTPGEQQVRVLAHFVAPASVALTADGRKAFVASPDSGAVLVIDTQTREIQPVSAFPARTGDSTSESNSACGDPAPTNRLRICPTGLAVDGAGNLFVADANSGNILRVDTKTAALLTVASGLRSPGDISFDRNGNLYVAEQGANRIVKFASMGADPSNLTLAAPAALPAPPAPRVCPQTAPFNFCDQPVGGTTPTQAFTLTNNTSAAVTGLTISFTGSNPGDFQTPGNTCGMSLAAGASCMINVAFSPAASGARAANLTVTDAGGDTASTGVTGTGDDYELALNGSPQEQSVIQGGTITFNLEIVPDAVFGGDVTIVCPADLPGFTTCSPSSSAVTVTPGTAAPFSVTFQTTYNGVTGGFPGNGSVPVLLNPGDRHWPDAPGSALWAIGLVLLALATYILARHKQAFPFTARVLPSRATWLVAFLLSACAFAALGGCKHHSVPANLNTPTGTTSLTVQATAQNAGRGITIILAVSGRG